MKDLTALNAVCPYYTMYPLDFPLGILERHTRPGDWVLDPFCGRGTTNFAARLLGRPTVGIDSNPVGVAIAKAKLPSVSVSRVVMTARRILARRRVPRALPKGTFWRWAYHSATLLDICRLREDLMKRCDTDERVVLRAIILGALHGPLTKGPPSYLSNQSPRTFAPKPGYAVRFWKDHELRPHRVEVLDVITRRTNWYLTKQPPPGKGRVSHGDSRVAGIFGTARRFKCVVTSPPYYGMRTYVPDQWLRSWFLGGPDEVIYRQSPLEITHSKADWFVQQLATVWKNAADACLPGAHLVVRFGGINDRRQDPLELMKASLSTYGWRIRTARRAGSADNGKRQARQFGRTSTKPLLEWDIYASLAS